MLDNLGQDYVRTARAKGMSERTVVLKHVLRNSLIPVVTVIALGMPVDLRRRDHHRAGVQGQRHRRGADRRDPCQRPADGADLTFIFAMLIVLFNLIADVLYGILDPRIRYD
jgi:peptide/nickel transport system permease protein